MDRSRFDVTVILPSRGTFSKVLKGIDIPFSIIQLPMGLIRLKRGKTLKSFLSLCAFFFVLTFFFLKLCIFLKRNRFNLIVTNTVKSHLYGSIAARLCSIPLIWRFHDVLVSPDFGASLVRFVALFAGSFPEKIYAVSKITKTHLVRCGVRSDKVEVIFNAVDNGISKVRRSRDIREEFKLRPGVRLVGCVGRIIPQKGQKILLKAIPGVIERFPEVFFLTIGDPSFKEEAYRDELLEIVRKHGLEEKVGFCGFRDDIGSVMRHFDALVFPSLAPEAFGLSVLEAMRLGKPVIASDTGGVREMIEDRVNGLLVEPNHPEQITEAILFLFMNPDLSARIGKKAKETAEQKFSLKNYVSSMEEAMEKWQKGQGRGQISE